MRLRGKVAMVTGSTRGIGRDIAERFASEGAKVIVTGRSATDGAQVVDAIRTLGNEALFTEMDVSDPDQVQRAVTCAVEAFGPITVLVNNAAPTTFLMGGSDQPLHQIPADTLKKMIDIGLFGAMWCCRGVLPSMMEAGTGSIINVSSLAGQVGLSSCPAYSSAKGGLMALTRQLAVDYAAAGIRSNSLTVGLVIHELNEALVATPEMRRAFEDIQLTRLGVPADVSHAAVYFASDESAYVTGANLNVDGGSMARGPMPTVDMTGSTRVELQNA